MRFQTAPLILLASLLLAGCSDSDSSAETALQAVSSAERFELLSLDPYPQEMPPEEGFHGYRVLGRVTIADPPTRNRLIGALQKGVEGNDGMAAACFNPRHGISATRDGQTTDLVICFECLQVSVYQNDQRQKGFLTLETPQPTFDAVLRANSVPLPEH